MPRHSHDADLALLASKATWIDALELAKRSLDAGLDVYALRKLDDQSGGLKELSSMLGLAPISSKRQGKAAQEYKGMVPQLQWPCYQSKPNREKLQRVLVAAIKCKGRVVGTQPAFILLCASAFAVLQTERLAFRAVMKLYDRLKLGQYFEEQVNANAGSVGNGRLRYDSMQVWRHVQRCQPCITDVFSTHSCEDLFFKLMAAWLPSVFICAMDLKQQPLSAFLPLLDRIVVASSKEDARKCCRINGTCLSELRQVDSREALRIVAACVLMRQQKVILAARSRLEMEGVVAWLSTYVLVDDALLVQINEQLHLFEQNSSYAYPCMVMDWMAAIFGQY